ncbi:hypothetical protein [Planotetraspora mira]|uniref:Uncharacterized protein n=1 Tax=Planotetraspora mira TaxID=58121 RepID=A0A8J3TMV2_9ACTN|nr:hypothetical protein [Planotetraspora mira]GII29338.1 hypothetical protein Pmi06nite_27800 [Planotetraspora mira]
MRTRSLYGLAAAAMIIALTTAVGPAQAAPALQAASQTASQTAPASPAAVASPRTPPQWKIFYAGRLTEGFLHSVAAPSPSSAWAVGQYQDEDGHGHAAVLRWNGRGWSLVPPSSLPDMKYWYSVSASSAHDVWIYGWNEERAGVAHFDGRKWREVAFPDLPEGAPVSYAEVASVRGGTWLAGETWVSRRVHGGWKTKTLPEGVRISSIDARSATDAWIAGTAYSAEKGLQPYTAHWNGHAWKPVKMPADNLGVNDIWAQSGRSVWVTGLIPVGEGWTPTVLHWNGKSWKNVRMPDEGQWPLAISGNRGEVWVTGDPAGFAGPPLYWRFDGRSWRTVAGRLPAGGRAETVTGLAPIRGTSRLWAVGSYIVDDGEVAHSFGLVQRDR